MKRQSGTFQMLVTLGAEIPWEIAMGLGWGMTLSHVSEFGMPLGTLMSLDSPSHPTLGTCCFSVPCSPHSRPPRVLQVLPLIPEPGGNLETSSRTNTLAVCQPASFVLIPHLEDI